MKSVPPEKKLHILKMGNLKLKYLENYKSKSREPSVLKIYKFILENEGNDTDYWWTDCGPNDLSHLLEELEIEMNWKALEDDLKFWSDLQLELFLYSIMNGYSYNLNQYKEYLSDKELFRTKTKIVTYRTDLIIPILKIGLERDKKLSNDIILVAMDEIFFIVDNFETLLWHDKKYIDTINEILDIVGKQYVFSEYPELERKIKTCA